MTHIRSALVAGMLLFGGALVASAQAPAQTPVPQAQQQGHRATGRMGARRHGDPALKGLTLSAQEQANVKAVRDKYAPQLKALRAQAKASGTRGQAMKVMQSERADVRAALSADNQTKYDANVAQMKQHMGKRRQGTVPTKPGV